MPETPQTSAIARWGVPSTALPAAVSALGIVYGDIGTSPLYAFKQAADAGGTLSPESIIGIVSERGSPRNARGTWLYDAMGHGYFFLGDYEKAIAVSKKGLHQDPSLFGALVTLACTYAQLGRREEAKHYVDELLLHSALLAAGAAKEPNVR